MFSLGKRSPFCTHLLVLFLLFSVSNASDKKAKPNEVNKLKRLEKSETDDKKKTLCPICFEEIEKGTAYQWPKCFHEYHKRCRTLKAWMADCQVCKDEKIQKHQHPNHCKECGEYIPCLPFLTDTMKCNRCSSQTQSEQEKESKLQKMMPQAKKAYDFYHNQKPGTATDEDVGNSLGGGVLGWYLKFDEEEKMKSKLQGMMQDAKKAYEFYHNMKPGTATNEHVEKSSERLDWYYKYDDALKEKIDDARWTNHGQCFICRDDIEQDTAYEYPKCHHKYHKKCVEMWKEGSAKPCQLCFLEKTRNREPVNCQLCGAQIHFQKKLCQVCADVITASKEMVGENAHDTVALCAAQLLCAALEVMSENVLKD